MSTMKRKPEIEMKVKQEPVEPVLKKPKFEDKTTSLSASAAFATEQQQPSPQEKQKEKKKKKAKSYFDDL